LSGVSVVETILIFVVIPLGVVLLFALLILVPGRVRKARYKPGQAWEYPPVWWEPHPVHGPAAGGHDAAPTAIGSSVYPEPHALEAGSGHGSSAHGATAVSAPPVPVPSGPLGGARGTW
jgi:hypothetical protein